jgi:hypothetical protein
MESPVKGKKIGCNSSGLAKLLFHDKFKWKYALGNFSRLRQYEGRRASISKWTINKVHLHIIFPLMDSPWKCCDILLNQTPSTWNLRVPIGDSRVDSLTDRLLPLLFFIETPTKGLGGKNGHVS